MEITVEERIKTIDPADMEAGEWYVIKEANSDYKTAVMITPSVLGNMLLFMNGMVDTLEFFKVCHYVILGKASEIKVIL